MATETINHNVKILVSLTISALASIIIQLIEKWVWSPFWTLMIFLVVLALDYISALLLSFKRGRGFDSTKSRKFVFQLFAQLSILGVIFNFPRLNEIFGHAAAQPILKALPGLLFVFMYSYNILSLVKNCTLLGGFNGKVAEFLKKYIDPHKNEVKD